MNLQITHWKKPLTRKSGAQTICQMGNLLTPCLVGGTPDIESLKTDAFELAGMLEGAPGRFGQLQKSTQKVDSSAQFTTLRATAKKYQRTWHMRLGMAEQVVQGKTLSPKQIKWMSTNWIGGTTKFIKDFSGSKNTKILKALQKIVRQIDNLAN